MRGEQDIVDDWELEDVWPLTQSSQGRGTRAVMFGPGEICHSDELSERACLCVGWGPCLKCKWCPLGCQTNKK